MAEAGLLEVDVGADQHVVEQEDPALLGLDQLPTVTIHSLRQRLAEKQLPLARGQQLGEGDVTKSTPTSVQAVTQTSPRQRPRILWLCAKGTQAGRGGGGDRATSSILGVTRGWRTTHWVLWVLTHPAQWPAPFSAEPATASPSL